MLPVWSFWTPFVFKGRSMAHLKNPQSSTSKSLKLSNDENLESLLQNVVKDVKGYADHLMSQIIELSDIGRSLSGIYDLDTLLEVIVDKARGFTHADAGILYMKDDAVLRYMVVQNDSRDIRLGGTTGKRIHFDPVTLEKTNVAAFAAMEGISINIPDIYNSDLFDFTQSRQLDRETDYRSQSILVVPMRNHENEVIGVLQLINARDPQTGGVIAFSPDCQNLTESLVTQAAMATSNVKLITDMEKLFEAFVEVMATAIDEKSPITGGHIRRVSDLTLTMAETVNAMTSGCYKDVSFNADQLHELRIASWMHDIGKVTTPVEIIEKGKKLEALFNRIHFIDLRMKYVSEKIRTAALEQKIELLENHGTPGEIEFLERKTRQKLEEMQDIRGFMKRCNEPYDSLQKKDIERLQEIAQMTFIDEDGKEQKFLTANELENLSIPRGSITKAEREVMKEHAYITLKMLQQIPFTKQLKNIPKFAGAHHECINGKGYPLGLKGDEIPFEGKLMAVTDIAEALTAHDRPYKKAMPLEKVYGILRSMVQNGQLDHNLVEIFIQERVYEKYQQKYGASGGPSPGNSIRKRPIRKNEPISRKIMNAKLPVAS